MSARTMLRATVTGVTAALLLTLGGIGAGAAAPARPPAAAPAAPAGPAVPVRAPVADLGACVAGGGTGDILLLVDESGSLTASDPELSRVTSATYFLEQLTRSAEAGGFSIDVQLSVFGHDYTTLQDWTTLDESSLPSLRTSIAGLAQRVGGVDTDYWTALDGARRDLAARAAARGEAPGCQAVVWFTDGELDFFVRTSADHRTRYGTEKVFAPGIELTSPDGASAVRAAAAADLCRAGGLADQVRSSGVALYGVGLNGSTSTPQNFDFFESLVAGRSAQGAASCGELIDPAPGEFHMATDLDSLLFAFDALSSPGSAPISQVTGICQVTSCADQSHRFVLDASTPDVRILASAGVDGLEAALVLPSGEVVSLGAADVGVPQRGDVHGLSIAYTWQSERTVAIDLSQADADVAGWTGLWQLVLIDPTGSSQDKTSQSNIHISGSLRPTWVSADDVELRAGEQADGLTFGLVDRAGRATAPEVILGSVSYSVTFQDATGQVTTIVDTTDPAVIGSPQTADLTGAAVGDGLVTMRLAITTAPVTLASGEVEPGTALEPVSVAIPVTVMAPPSFPVLGSSINFGEVTGAVSSEAALPTSGEGCVWIAADATPSIVASPEGLGKITVTASSADSQDSCSAAGGSGLVLRLTTQNAGNGTLNGSIPVMISSADGTGEPIEVQVPFTASLAKPLNSTNFWLALVAALLLGPGIPALILYSTKWAVSKIPPRALVGTVIEVQVGSQVLRDGQVFALGPADLRNTVALPRGGARRLNVAGADIRTRLGASPSGAGYVEVRMDGRVAASSAPVPRTRRGNARLPLAIHDSWVLFRTPGAPAGAASLLVLVGADTPEAQRRELEADIRARVPDRLVALTADEAPGAAPGPTPAPFAGAGYSSPQPDPWGPASPSTETHPWGT